MHKASQQRLFLITLSNLKYLCRTNFTRYLVFHLVTRLRWSSKPRKLQPSSQKIITRHAMVLNTSAITTAVVEKNMSPGRVLAYLMMRISVAFCTVKTTRLVPRRRYVLAAHKQIMHKHQCAIKTCDFIFHYNSCITWWIFIPFSD